MSEFDLLKKCVKYPTSIIIRGQDLLGIELAKSLLEQGGFVILIDEGSNEIDSYLPLIDSYTNLLLMDYSGLSTLQSELRRLDYVFYLNHQFSSQQEKVSTQQFLQASNYLDAILDLTTKFDAKFLLSTSIKAHQTIVSSKVIDINYELSSAEKYSLYSELEIQRYSESLVKEYQDKVGINARIVRVGTLLGRGMEIDVDSSLIKLILQALQGESLVIPGDGLETDYYVHYLDAAYGIIKAQFSPNTKGQVYTLANEEEVSLLAISYKLIELIPTAKEIRFDSNDDSLPPIRLYKPAINLTSIGWSARVSFERGLSQTIDYLKARLSEVNGNINNLEKEVIPITDKNRINKSLKDKILDFFFISTPKEDPDVVPVSTNVNTEGALARLIAERKNQEKARKGSIIVANNKLREALIKKPERTFLQRIDLYFNDLFHRLRTKLSVLKNMTLTDFIFWVLGISAFLLIYFIFLSPILSLSRSLIFMHYDLNKLSSSINNIDYNEANITCDSIWDNLKNIEERVSDLEYLFIITDKQDSYTDLQTFIVEMQDLLNGYENITKALIPFGEMANGYSFKFFSRLDGQLLSVESNKDYSNEIDEIYKNRSLLTIGINSINASRSYIDEYFIKLPTWFQDIFKKDIESLSNIDNDLPVLEQVFNYIPLLTGNDKERYYLLLLQDEERFTPSGGVISGYFLLKVSDGAIISVDYTDTSSFTNINPNLEASTIEEINLVSTKLINSSNIVFEDINYIPSRDVWFKEYEQVIEAKQGVEIDMSIVFDLKALAKLSFSGIEFKQTTITEQNFFDKINSFLGVDSTSKDRNELLNSYFALILEKTFNDIKKDGLLLSLNELITNDHIRIYSKEPMFKKFLLSFQPDMKYNDNFDIGMSYDAKNVKFTNRSEINVIGKVNIGKDLSSTKNIKIEYLGQNLSGAYFCAPTGKDFIVTETEEEFVSKAFDLSELNRTCAILLPDDDLEYRVSYYSFPFEKGVNSSYNYLLKINSLPGVLTSYDIEFLFETPIENVKSITEGVIRQEDSYLYKGSFWGSKLFNFEINLNGE